MHTLFRDHVDDASFYENNDTFELFDKVKDARLPLCDVIDRGDKNKLRSTRY